MRTDRLSGVVKRRRGKTTIRVPCVRVADDLVKRDFSPPGPNQLCVADITYLRSWEGWLYLAVVLDCCSRRIVGSAIEHHLRAELVVDALDQALQRRRPGRRLVHHFDQGSQYVSLALGRRCRLAKIEQSMGGRGSAYDNATTSNASTTQGDATQASTTTHQPSTKESTTPRERPRMLHGDLEILVAYAGFDVLSRRSLLEELDLDDF